MKVMVTPIKDAKETFIANVKDIVIFPDGHSASGAYAIVTKTDNTHVYITRPYALMVGPD